MPNVFADEFLGDLPLLATEQLRLQLDLQDERSELHHVVPAANILEEILLEVLRSQLKEELVLLPFVQLCEVLEHVQACEDPLLDDEMVLVGLIQTDLRLILPLDIGSILFSLVLKLQNFLVPR